MSRRKAPGHARLAGLALVLGAQGIAFPISAQVLNQNAFLYNYSTNSVTTNTPPGINWQSKHGVPITTNLDAALGSDGRSPTVLQQQANGLTNLDLPTPGQFRGWVGFGALAVATSSSALSPTNSNILAQNAALIGWPHLDDGQGNITYVLRAAQVGAPYLNRLVSIPFGAEIPPPLADYTGTNTFTTDQSFAYWASQPFATSSGTNDGAYYSSAAHKVFATQPGQISIVWRTLVPTPGTPPATAPASVGYLTINTASYQILFTNTYLVSGEPVKLAQKMYWTEGDHTLGQPVSIAQSGLTVKPIYNSAFPELAPGPGDTNPNVLASNRNKTMWIESIPGSQAAGVGSMIKADNATGPIFLEITGQPDTSGNTFIGFEIVNVYQDPAPIDINVELGTRIPAYPDRRDDSQLSVVPPQNASTFYYAQSIPNSTEVVLWATYATPNLNDFEAHWLVTGVAGLRWPYLFNRYHEDWPKAAAAYVNYVRPLVATDAEAALTAVKLPGSEAPSITYQDDNNHPRAHLSGDLFYTFLGLDYPAHRTLIQFLSGNNVAYERVFSCLDVALKTNSLFVGSVATNLDAWTTNLVLNFPNSVGPSIISQTAYVGNRLVAPPGEIGSLNGAPYVAGYVVQTNGNTFNYTAYQDPFIVGFDQAAQGAIIPVNAIPGSNTLEVLWFRSDSDKVAATNGFAPSYWPAVIGHYTLLWPTDAPEIILASNDGSGPLDSLQANGSIYHQPDRSQPGYNPNEEHGVMLAGQAYALRDDLNHTIAGTNYTSEPFVLINYTGSDGRPSMAPYHVRREAPEQGILFDYVAAAGTRLQAPMPLPLLDKPLEEVATGTTNYNTEPPDTSGDLPVGWANLPADSPLTNYGKFTFQDRKHEFWVYRGLHAGLPALQVGAYNATSGLFDPLPAATAIEDQPFVYYLHASRQWASLTISTNGLPLPAGLSVGLTTNGLAITGTPITVGTNVVSLVTQDTGDNALVTNTLSIAVVASGTPVAQPPLSITSTNQYSAQTVTYSDRPPFLAEPPTTNNSFTMRFYYKNQDGFDWPGVAAPPAVGGIVPYLRSPGSTEPPAAKTTRSLDIVYRPIWPSLINNRPIPKLASGETLTTAKHRLAAVRGQSSVQVLYQQSLATNNIVGTNRSVALFDPTVQKTSALSNGLPASVISQPYLGKFYFPNLPPNLAQRLYYDPQQAKLVFKGQFVNETTGESYLLLNVLAGDDLARVQGLCNTNDPKFGAWLGAVTNLSARLYTFDEGKLYSNDIVVGTISGSYVADTNRTVTNFVSDLMEVTSSDQPVDSYALSATGPGLGYITYIVGNARNPDHLDEPISVYLARVAAPLYQGQLKVIEDPNPLSELLSFQHTADLAGKSANYEYDWRIAPPVDGQPPTSDPANWTRLTNGIDIAHFTLDGGAGLLSLSDNYVTMRYRETDSLADPANTNWSTWTGYPDTYTLAEGFIKRALKGINPFNQRTKDLLNNSVNTTASIISQAGHRWEGDVALNADTIQGAGLIEIYETILNRGRALSINAGYNYGPANDALLLVAGYLGDLYSLVANDARADAANPTIGIGTANQTYGSIATALFAFKGQEPSLLEEELALLRGRDDFLSPGVKLNPVYNRLYWNYTRGIDAGEVIYALNYNILDQNNTNGVTAEDAAALFPMGHGDAYGHYLTVLGNYYSLLMNPNFDWVPRIETVNILGAAVSVDYQDERKFAASSAALARSGLQVFDLTRRKDYQAGTSGGWSAFSATRSNPLHTYRHTGVTNTVTRYWGMDHWATRTAQGAYLNWVVGNAILPAVDPDPAHEGIQKVDRTTVPELTELPQTAAQLQTDLDNAEAGFTPLNLPQNAIPFDINPLQVTGVNPQTHFEQIYQRATTALNNAVVAFDDAQNVTQLMRSEQDSLANLQAAVVNQELAYNNQLIELYGTPYPDDMGPGKTYNQDYTGPDLLHYNYAENPALNSFSSFLYGTQTNTYYFDVQKLPDDWSANMYTSFPILKTMDPSYNDGTTANPRGQTNYVVKFVLGPDGFFDKPSGWTSRRSSPGSIQEAISTILNEQYAVRSAAKSAQNDKGDLDKAMNVFDAQIYAAQVQYGESVAIQGLTIIRNQFDVVYNIAKIWNAAGQKRFDAINKGIEGLPDLAVLGTSSGGNQIRSLKMPATQAALASSTALAAKDAIAYTTYQKALDLLATSINALNIAAATTKLDIDTKNAVLTVVPSLKAIKGDLANLNQQLQELSDAQAAFRALEAKGNRIQLERLSYRQHASALVQGFRTRDAAFRIFQNEKLERYKTLFDLSAKYAYLAAQAYDYETGLLGTSDGKHFLNRIVSARALGVVNNGQPQFAGSSTGDPGLSSALAEMKADWDVVKGRLGFNNPDGYGTTVSLRAENYRILPGSNSDITWQQVLNQGRVADLRADDDVSRHCLQLENGSGLPVPGIVLTFSTTITDGQNLFGNQLAPGDHNFSSSSFATKIFAAGICLDGYVGMDNPSAAGGTSPPDPTLDPNALAATPYVYLIPVGEDSMRSPPLGDVSHIRTWSVDDVTIPLPFNVGASAFSSTPFYTAANSLSEPLFGVRKHQAFRPVSVTSVFNTSIYGANGALQPSQYTNKRLIGRSIWNSKWKLVIPGRNLLADPNQGLDRFILSVKDVKLYFITYSYSGN